MYRYMYQTRPKTEWRQLWSFVASVQDPEFWDNAATVCRYVSLFIKAVYSYRLWSGSWGRKFPIIRLGIL
jgi:hypothetical protein